MTDKGGRLIGRSTINEMVDLTRKGSESEILNMADLHEEEGIFVLIWRSVHNRWARLATSLITAFVVSWVIGLFGGPIGKPVVLAVLVPIAVSIGGNSGNQTITMTIRTTTLDQVQPTSSSRNHLLHKKLGIALVNSPA